VGDRPARGAAAEAPVQADRPWARVRGGACGHAGRGPSQTAAARAPGGVIGALFLFVLLILLFTRGFAVAARALGGARAEVGGDRAALLLALAVRSLPARHRDWGQAMRAELDQVRGRRARWRFSFGCAWAATVIRTRAAFGSRERGGEGLRTVVLSGITIALALAAYGLVHYPGLRSGAGAWASLTGFVAVLLGYAAVALTLSRGTAPEAVSARRCGLCGGLAIGGVWLVVLAPTAVPKSSVFVPLAVALLAPAGVAAVAGSRAALWSGLVGGLLVFIVWVSATYLHDGGPYDAGLLRDFDKSGAGDLATYAVSDNLGAALGLLVVIPTVALALGSLSAQLSRR
jgi:hypothetical protein